MKKVVFNLSILVDETIHSYMSQFKTLGIKAKKYQRENKPQAKIEEVHKEMAQIYDDLEPFEERVRAMYPHMIELFDMLTKLAKKKR